MRLGAIWSEYSPDRRSEARDGLSRPSRPRDAVTCTAVRLEAAERRWETPPGGAALLSCKLEIAATGRARPPALQPRQRRVEIARTRNPGSSQDDYCRVADVELLRLRKSAADRGLWRPGRSSAFRPQHLAAPPTSSRRDAAVQRTEVSWRAAPFDRADDDAGLGARASASGCRSKDAPRCRSGWWWSQRPAANRKTQLVVALRRQGRRC